MLSVILLFSLFFLIQLDSVSDYKMINKENN